MKENKHSFLVKNALIAIRAKRVSSKVDYDFYLMGFKYIDFITHEQEFARNSEIPDIYFTRMGRSFVLEVKTSRADLLNDKNKPFRKNEDEGVGDYRFYLFEKDSFDYSGAVLPGWGVIELYFDGKKPCLEILQLSQQFNANKKAEVDYFRIRLQECLHVMKDHNLTLSRTDITKMNGDNEYEPSI